MMPNISIERTSYSVLCALPAAAHLNRGALRSIVPHQGAEWSPNPGGEIDKQGEVLQSHMAF